MALNDPVRSELSDLVNPQAGAITASGKMSRTMPIIGMVLCLVMSGPVSGDTWRGIQVAPEHRCSEYDRQRDYRYPQSVEKQIVQETGAIYGPYTGTCFDSMRQSDIEHIVAVSEAHDSGLCARDRTIRRQFASDVRNLTLARPDINRNQKRAKDAAEWLPDRNRC
ncbi:MAG: hypothetical protein OXE84_13925 [Rhodobacteraceae bacterium]|nr:hypothetical protein [Paracoccaceae bacterium]